jgi:hypothetical protein
MIVGPPAMPWPAKGDSRAPFDHREVGRTGANFRASSRSLTPSSLTQRPRRAKSGFSLVLHLGFTHCAADALNARRLVRAAPLAPQGGVGIVRLFWSQVFNHPAAYCKRWPAGGGPPHLDGACPPLDCPVPAGRSRGLGRDKRRCEATRMARRALHNFIILLWGLCRYWSRQAYGNDALCNQHPRAQAQVNFPST